MNNITITIFFYAVLLIITLLSSCVIYLIFAYRKLLDKYSNLSIKKDKDEMSKKIKIDTNDFVNRKVQEAVEKATIEAVDTISQNAKNVSLTIKRKSLEKLMEEEKGEERAIANEFDAAKTEIQNYKAQEFEKIRKNANLILSKIMPEIVKNSISTPDQEKMILEEIENAKRSIL